MTNPPTSSGDIRARILAEATASFAAKGFRSTSIRDITSAAGVNVAAVSYHFGSKADLYREVLRQALQSPQSDQNPMGHSVSTAGTACLRALVAGIFDSFDAHQGSVLQKILAHEQSEPSGVLGPVLGDLLRPRHAALVATLAREAGCPADHPAVHRIVKTLVDAIKGYQADQEGVLKHMAPAAFDSPDYRGAAIDSLVEQVTDMLCGVARRYQGTAQ